MPHIAIKNFHQCPALMIIQSLFNQSRNLFKSLAQRQTSFWCRLNSIRSVPCLCSCVHGRKYGRIRVSYPLCADAILWFWWHLSYWKEWGGLDIGSLLDISLWKFSEHFPQEQIENPEDTGIIYPLWPGNALRSPWRS